MIPSLTNLLDILSPLLSGIYSDILSHVEKRVKISASLATTSTAISDLQRRRWPLYVRVCVCESIRMVHWLSQEYLTFFLAFYLASFLPFFLTFFLALCLTYVLTSYLEAFLAFYLACVRFRAPQHRWRYSIRVQAVRSCTFVKIDPRQIGK